jgi:glycerol-3-phosphate dehydrogenase
VFAYQWESVTLVGTTDVDHQVPLQVDPRISEEEITYLLEFLQKAFPEQSLESSDIQATFSGIRAVVNTGKVNPSKESREHVLWSEEGLLTITGGKLTTFRRMAQAALNLARSQLPERKLKSGSNTQHILDPLSPDTLNQMQFTSGLAPAMRLRLLGRYGNRSASILENTPGSEFESIGGSLYTWAELRWACREAVIHLEDILLRRVRLGLVLPQGGIPLLDQMRGIVQGELGWDDKTWQEEANQYRQLWQTAYSTN